jgi:cytochrome c oxidase subunit 3
MAGAKNHDYHILPPSFWPLMGSMSALVMAFGAICWMHPDVMPAHGGSVFFAGLAGVLATMFFWWTDVVKEAHAGDHTPVVSAAPALWHDPLHRLGSDVLRRLVLGLLRFLAVPDRELSEPINRRPVPAQGDRSVLDPFDLPLLNTLILLCSGTTVTWAHHSLIHGNRDGLKKGLWATILLGAAVLLHPGL